MIVSQKKVDDRWVLLNEDGSITCPECGNVIKILVSSIEGLVEINVEKVKEDLRNFPTKVIYGVCPVCGMEYVFHLVDNKLYLEASEEEK